MRTTLHSVLRLVLALGLIAVLTGAYGQEGAPPRYPIAVTDTDDLVQLATIGVVADTFGYDGLEMLYQVRAMDMPTADIIPVFTLSYLSGESYRRVVEQRVEGKTWAQIAENLKIELEAFNDLVLPASFRFTTLSSVPDDVMLDMMTCSALALSLGQDPDRIMDLYRKGWHPLDVLTAAQIAHRSGRQVSVLLSGTPRAIDWYKVARDAGVDLARMAAEGGRLRDNMEPLVREQAQRSDLETRYALEIAAENYKVAYETVRDVRYRYLLSPSEVVITFYLSDLGPYDPYRVARYYVWDGWRSWGPTIVGLGIPRRHFADWSIWVGGSIDFLAIDAWVLRDALLGHALYHGGFVPVPVYSYYDPWFTWRDAIFYGGIYHRHHVPFKEYYQWRRSGRSWRDYPHYSRDRADYQRETDILHGRRVGIIEGHKSYEPPRAAVHRSPVGPEYRGGTRGHARAYEPPITPGLIEGRKSAPPNQRYQPAGRPGYDSRPVPRYGDQSGPHFEAPSGPRRDVPSGPRYESTPTPRFEAPSGRPSETPERPGGQPDRSWSFDRGSDIHVGGGPVYNGPPPGATRFGELIGAPSGYGSARRFGSPGFGTSRPGGSSPWSGSPARPSWSSPGGSASPSWSPPRSSGRPSGSGYGLITGSQSGARPATAPSGGPRSGGGRRR
ncbi:MAG: hypothetical protein HPY44_05535 [Armatimonadetes bacterium]|nr:hypothetical protein [Armatimonadota bacterium]